MAILAQELLAACAVFSILDNICAIAFRTVKNYRFADHLPFIPSFTKYHYQIIYRAAVKRLIAFPSLFMPSSI
jgi:hypothetical protein